MDPATIPLAGWLSAGYVMLTESMDSTWRRLVDNAVGAESWSDVELAFEALKAESAYRRAESEKHEAEARSKAGAPAHFSTLPQERLDQAVADVASWAGVKREDTAPEPDEVEGVTFPD